MKKTLTCLAALLALACLTANRVSASETDGDNLDKPSVNVALNVRADFAYDDMEGGVKSSGFHGRYFNLMVNGRINRQLSYNWRQRLNKMGDYANDVFAATDWIYLRYQPTDWLALSGGKEVVLIGGYEYDAAPIDIFFASMFWNNIACYQFGATASLLSPDGRNSLSLQMCNSPYQSIGNRCYAYNLFWNGNLGWFRTLWSVNLIEYSLNHYANFIALGNHFLFGDFNLQLDLMNRATSHHKYFCDDYSVIAKAEYDVTPWMTVMLKGGHDKFRPMPGAPESMDKTFCGGGLEFYPLHGSRNLRLHALYHHSHDAEGTRVNEFTMGLKWQVNIFSK